MSSFNSGDNQDHNTTGETTSFVEQLVGEGKKFKDAEELAKGKLESDRYIQELTAKIQQLESTNQVNDKLDNLLAKLSDANKAAQGGSDGDNMSNTNTDTQVNTKPQIDAEGVEDLVKRVLEQTTKQSQKEQNLSKVESELKGMFGERSNDVVRAKAEELGVSTKYLQDIAAESPQAFLQMVSPSKSSSSTNFPAAKSGDALNVTGRNAPPEQERWSYFKELRKTNPKAYYSAFDRIQELQDKYGADVFYNT